MNPSVSISLFVCIFWTFRHFLLFHFISFNLPTSNMEYKNCCVCFLLFNQLFFF
jgi:hypothetical protein